MGKKKAAKRSLRSFHFSLGDSSEGAIGMCARVRARSRREAVSLLKRALSTGESGEYSLLADDDRDRQVEYCNAYVNPDAISVKDIDEVNDG